MISKWIESKKMSWLEFYYKKHGKDITNPVHRLCPCTVSIEGIDCDQETAKINGLKIVGCRGISCEDCWKQGEGVSK